MLLKSLELQGFKSFADKTVLDLSSNIVAVVGPNGSGKSNITDAIRWLLGERDARNLRGGKVQDLIFAGTEKKPRMGMAQATLHFDNSSNFFPVDFTDVSISRKVSRDGESLFFLNKSEVRLKDVIDFFAKSKLGARGLTIINQGSSDMFIKAAPIERKEMVEEILGLKEFQLKKTESIRKLKNTAANLDTVNASLQELKPHLKFLKKQAARYEERDAMATELKKLEDNFFGGRLKSLKSEFGDSRSKLTGIESLIAKEEKIGKNLEGELLKIKGSEPESALSFRDLETEKNNLLKKRGDLEREFGKLEARIEFETSTAEAPNIDSLKVLKDLKSIAESLLEETDMKRLRDQIALMLQKIDAVFESPSKIAKSGANSKFDAAKEKLTEDLKHLDLEIKALISKEESIKSGLSAYNKTFTASYEKFEAQKQKVNELISDKDRLNFDIEKTELKIANLKEELMQTGRTLESVEEGFGSAQEASLGDASEGAITKRMFKLRGDLASIGDVDQGLVKEAKETEDRYNFLSRQVEDLEAAMKDLKNLIKDLDKKLHTDFTKAIETINDELGKLMKMVFGGGSAKLILKEIEHKNILEEIGSEEGGSSDVKSGSSIPNQIEDLNGIGKDEYDIQQGIEIEVSLPKKRVKGLDVLSGGERTLVSIAVLFALISVSPPPFLVLDEVDAALDEDNARRCGAILKEFSKKSQFVIVTHNRATMEAADVLYGVTMEGDGTSRLISLKLDQAEKTL